MAGINKAIILGNLGGDPESRDVNGDCVTNFTIATSEKWKDKDGNDKTKTEWHRIVAWRRLGEVCRDYLSKGKQVYIEGKIQTRNWEDKDGNKRYTTEIVASTMQMLGSKSDSGQSSPSGDPGATPSDGAPDMDEIPF